MSSAVLEGTNFYFPGQTAVHHGKVRDVYDFGNSLMLIATDRYSAFDRNLALVKYKGELLTAISRWWFEQTASIVKNHVISYPAPNTTWCHKYKVLPIEMIVRGYITGVTVTSLWHNYSQGQRDFGDFTLPNGLSKNQKLPKPVLTPTTKFEKHDRPLTARQVVDEGLVDAQTWQQLQKIALRLFSFGQKTAEAKGLVLVDTKYEFGLDDQNNIVLIDELHTPDSSRYWNLESYESQIVKGEEPDNYDKEFLRLWFKARFDPYKDKVVPKPPQEVLDELTRRYIFVYERLTGQTFKPLETAPITTIQRDILKTLGKQ